MLCVSKVVIFQGSAWPLEEEVHYSSESSPRRNLLRIPFQFFTPKVSETLNFSLIALIVEFVFVNCIQQFKLLIACAKLFLFLKD